MAEDEKGALNAIVEGIKAGFQGEMNSLSESVEKSVTSLKEDVESLKTGLEKEPVHHFVLPWQKKCLGPNCGVTVPDAHRPKIPEDQRPTHICTDCGMPVGREEQVKEAKGCWNCGGTKARPI